MKNCILVAGANGEIGKEFIKKLLPHNKVVAISRNKATEEVHSNLTSVTVDLTNPEELEKSFSSFDVTMYDRIILLHSIGKDKFENIRYPRLDPLTTIDPQVYSSNVNTYKYLARLLIKKISHAQKTKPVKLKLVMIGSVADKYGLQVMPSFSESKNIVRSYMRDAVSCYPWVTALTVNVSSVITKSAFEVRPFADTTYWLTPEEVVERSWKEIISSKKGYREVDVYKKDPKFDSGYYFDDQAVYEKWARYVWGKAK